MTLGLHKMVTEPRVHSRLELKQKGLTENKLLDLMSGIHS